MRILFFFILSLSFFKSFSDAGNSYRFYTEVTLKNETKIHGYIYHYSFNTFSINNNSLKEFLIKDHKKSLDLYTHIVTTPINSKTIDFSSENYLKRINIENIDSINVSELLIFPASNKLFTISAKEFDIIETNKPFFLELYHHKIYENCSLIAFTWNQQNIIQDEVTKINDSLNTLIKVNNIEYEALQELVNSKKEELIKHKILLIMYCEVL